MNRLLLVWLTCLSPAFALANSSTAGYSNEGLKLLKTENIRMAKEDLFLSTREIRVRYTFENLTQEPIQTLVAFPFPKMDAITEWDVSKASHFKLKIGGKSQKTRRETVYTLEGKEYRDKAQAEKLLAAERKKREAAEEEGAPFEAFVQDFELWEQRFPAGQSVDVEISYRPSVGADLGWNQESYQSAQAQKTYCIDASTAKGLDKALAALGNADAAPSGPYLQWLSYVLVTGNNWAGPIGQFHLTIEKPAPNAILSLCMDGLKKTSATRFETTRENFRPERDLSLIFFHR
ncbi:DUF4424 family protein [Stigmatella aurantiaca]|nr:DUF4424 family protein [Stigmatella aurantiaca]